MTATQKSQSRSPSETPPALAKGKILVAFVTFILLTGATLYLANGFHTLLSSGGGDLKRRFDEQLAMAAGINPYGSIGENEHVKPVDDPGAYPPWSLTFASLLIIPCSLEHSKIFLALLNFGCLAYVASYAYFRFARYGRLAGVFAIASVLAISANAVALRLGQFSIIVFTLMVLTMQLSERGRFPLAGASLAFANLKPHIAGLVAVFFFKDRRYDALISMIAIITIATVVTCVRIWEGPLDLLLQMLQGTKADPSTTGWASARYGIFDFLLRIGMPHEAVVLGSAVIALLLTVVFASKVGSRDWISRMAIATTCALVFAYHRRYDFMAAWFLFAAWLDQLLSNPSRGSLWLARLVILGLLGLSVWFPVTEAMYLKWPVFYVMHVLWLGALAFYVFDRGTHCA